MPDQVEIDTLRGQLREEKEVVAALEESKADCERLLSKKIEELANARKQVLEEMAEEIEALRDHLPIRQAAELCRERAKES